MRNSFKTNFVNDCKPSSADVVELRNARFTDVINGCFFDPDVRVQLRNGKIVAMPGLEGETSEIKPDIIIDLLGKTVLPGLSNVHCHIQMINPTVFLDIKAIKARKRYHDLQVEKNMADCLARGITNIRDACTDDLRDNRQLIERINKREIPGPRILQAVVVGARGGYLTPEFRGIKKLLTRFLGLSTIPYEDKNSGIVAFPLGANEQQVRDAVDMAINERGADVIKVGESLEEGLINDNPNIMTIRQLQTITDHARRRGLQSTIHCVSVDTFKRSVQAGFSSLAHMPRDGELTKTDINAFLQSGCIIEPTLSVGYDMSWRLDRNPFYNEPNMEKLYAFRNRTFANVAKDFWLPELNEHVKAGFNKANLGKYNMFGILNVSKSLEHFSRWVRYGIENSRMLIEQGATIACGNDGGIQACTPAMVAHELAIFDLFMNDDKVSEKFDGVRAVQTATINSARSMGIDNKFGSIQTGKIADLAIVDGNPFEEINVIGKPVEALFMDGRLVINNCGLILK
jgi:imidazolonepropionase-like amidohydrolase